MKSAVSQLYEIYPLASRPKLNLVDLKYHLPPYNTTTIKPTTQDRTSPVQLWLADSDQIQPEIHKLVCENQDAKKQKNKERNIAV